VVGRRAVQLESNIHVRPERPPREEHALPRYLISVDAHAIDHVPEHRA
jgi:hypothetical protein